jgi:L-arabinonolactonase
MTGRPGSIALTTEPGKLLVASENGLVWLDWASGAVTPWIELEPPGTGNRLNDGRCDPAGRFWVGSMYVPLSAQRYTGMLHRVEPAGTTQVMRRGVGVANGLAFYPDGSVMYFADTPRRTVWAYTYDASTGTPHDERVFLDFGDLPGQPDGACVDEEGGYWVACVNGWTVLRVTPDGRIDRRVNLPVEKPTMCAFGGKELDLLYITSIGDGGSYPPAPGQQEPGGLFAFDPGVQGLPESLFGG